MCIRGVLKASMLLALCLYGAGTVCDELTYENNGINVRFSVYEMDETVFSLGKSQVTAGWLLDHGIYPVLLKLYNMTDQSIVLGSCQSVPQQVSFTDVCDMYTYSPLLAAVVAGVFFAQISILTIPNLVQKSTEYVVFWGVFAGLCGFATREMVVSYFNRRTIADLQQNILCEELIVNPKCSVQKVVLLSKNKVVDSFDFMCMSKDGTSVASFSLPLQNTSQNDLGSTCI